MWHIFCEESGDKQVPWINGSTDFYIVTAILVKEEDVDSFRNIISEYKHKVLRMKAPLEWKKLKPQQKKDDKLLGRFLKKIDENAPDFLVSNVICNKHETTGPGFIKDPNLLMNYLYGLMFKRIAWFLQRTNSRAKLTIDRNTDRLAQESLRTYISMVSRYHTGSHPRHSKPNWINPETDPVLGFADFISGISLRALSDYLHNVDASCKTCEKSLCIYDCSTSLFSYKRSLKYVLDWNAAQLPNWSWRGLLYHPFEYKDNYKHLFEPK